MNILMEKTKQTVYACNSCLQFAKTDIHFATHLPKLTNLTMKIYVPIISYSDGLTKHQVSNPGVFLNIKDACQALFKEMIKLELIYLEDDYQDDLQYIFDDVNFAIIKEHKDQIWNKDGSKNIELFTSLILKILDTKEYLISICENFSGTFYGDIWSFKINEHVLDL